MTAIGILLNGEKHRVEVGLTLQQLLRSFSLPDKRVAVELNGTVIRRLDWSTTTISEEDKIEVVHFVGGG